MMNVDWNESAEQLSESAGGVCSPTLVVMDDDLARRSHVADVLSMAGWGTRELRTPLELIRLLIGGERIDGLVVGPMVCGRRVEELLDFVRETAPSVARVAIVGGGPEAEARRELADVVVLLPWTPVGVISCCERALEARTRRRVPLPT